MGKSFKIVDNGAIDVKVMVETYDSLTPDISVWQCRTKGVDTMQPCHWDVVYQILTGRKAKGKIRRTMMGMLAKSSIENKAAAFAKAYIEMLGSVYWLTTDGTKAKVAQDAAEAEEKAKQDAEWEQRRWFANTHPRVPLERLFSKCGKHEIVFEQTSYYINWKWHSSRNSKVDGSPFTVYMGEIGSLEPDRTRMRSRGEAIDLAGRMLEAVESCEWGNPAASAEAIEETVNTVYRRLRSIQERFFPTSLPITFKVVKGD